MCRIMNWKTLILIIAMAFVCQTIDAQPRRWRHRPRTVVAVVTPSVEVCHDNCRFSQKERLAMAMSYLKDHAYLTIKRYAKMTELSKAAAEAELDAFAMDKKKPLQMVLKGKRKVYVKR